MRNQIEAGSKQAVDDFWRIKIMSGFLLVGAFPLSAGVLFHSLWLKWTGLAVIGVGQLCFAIELFCMVWSVLRSPKCRVAKTESKTVADEYLALGWTLRHVFRERDDGKPDEYLFEWLGSGDPVQVHSSKIVRRKCDDERLRRA